jgi:hypothetical protein
METEVFVSEVVRVNDMLVQSQQQHKLKEQVMLHQQSLQSSPPRIPHLQLS